MASSVSALRAARLRRIRALKKRGWTSARIGRELDLAPSTVRDYLNDPTRAKARIRQSRYSVVGVSMPADGTPIRSVKARWKRGGPHQGEGMAHAETRGRQLRAIIGKKAYAR